MIDHVIFATTFFYMQMRFDHDSFLLILSRLDSSFLQILTSNQAYHDFDQSRSFLSILLILEIVEKIKMLEDEIAESESSDTMMIEHEKDLIKMK
jgi:hypothetical protein